MKINFICPSRHADALVREATAVYRQTRGLLKRARMLSEGIGRA